MAGLAHEDVVSHDVEVHDLGVLWVAKTEMLIKPMGSFLWGKGEGVGVVMGTAEGWLSHSACVDRLSLLAWAYERGWTGVVRNS